MAQKQCTACAGTGYPVKAIGGGFGRDYSSVCHKCGGTGWVYESDPKRTSKPEKQEARTGRQEAHSAKREGCFIATVTYGSSLAPEVTILRQFRDEMLLPSKAGAVFVKLYYCASPPLAQLIAKMPLLRITVRDLLLNPLVRLVKSLLSRQ